MASIAMDDSILMSPPRSSVPPPLLGQSTPMRAPNRDPVPGTPRRGETLKTLTDGDKATLVLKVKEKFYEHRGFTKATENMGVRRRNPGDPAFQKKLSSPYYEKISFKTSFSELL